MSDPFQQNQPGLESPANHAFDITPDDSTDLATFARAVYIGGDGDLAVTMVDGSEVTFSGLLAGTILPVRVSRVKAAGTSAADLVGLV